MTVQYTFIAQKNFIVKANCRGHGGKVSHLDFSSNSQYLMSNCTSGDLLFWDSESGEMQSPKNFKSIQWDTNSCAFSFATQGVWSKYEDGTQFTSACKANSLELLVAVDNYGRIRLTNYPCVGSSTSSTKPSVSFIQRNGHSKGVSNCKFSCDDSFLFTTGESDGCLFQWKLVHEETQNYEEMKHEESIHESIFAEVRFSGKILDKPEKFENLVNNNVVAVCEMEEGIADASPLLPWQKTIVAPSKINFEDNSEPPDNLELSFVYGYTADISRQALMYSANGEMLFFRFEFRYCDESKSKNSKFLCQS